MKAIVLYHAHCQDGSVSAAVLKKFYFTEEDDDVVYTPVQYGEAPPLDLCRDRTVFIVDFSYQYETMREIEAVATNMIWIDHHKTAEATVQRLRNEDHEIDVLFDLNKSGAMLTRDWVAKEIFYVHDWSPESLTYPPLLVRYAQDRDLWQHKLYKTHEVQAWLKVQDRTLDRTVELLDELEGKNAISNIAVQGAAMLQYQTNMVAQIANQAKMVELHVQYPFTASYVVPAVESVVLQSEVGHKLYSQYPDAPFAIVYQRIHNDKWKYSLRTENGRIDVRKIAEAFGGGGHPSAAGFVISHPPTILDM